MGSANRTVKAISILLVGAGGVLLALNVFLGWSVNVALPLVIMMLGVGFYLLVFVLSKRWRWASLLYVPGSLLVALGLIFLLNVLTNDWQAWAYAWLLMVAGIGLGLVLANGQLQWRQEISLAGWGMVVGGVTLFALFGAIAGGPFIQVMAPILLAVGGLLLWRLRPEEIFPERVLRWFRPGAGAAQGPAGAPDQRALVEPLSARELEVLRLVDQGFSNAEIAARLVLAPSTVKTHINNIYGKLEVQTRVQAVRRARELGLL